jgi:hypothetical protein
VSQQDPPDLAAQRREIVIATLAAAVHRWHRDQIRAGVRAKRAASIAPSEHQQAESSRLDPAEDDRPDRPLPLDPDTAAGHVGGERAGGPSWR